MQILGAQWDKHNGPDGVNSHKIQFVVDDSQRECLKQLIDLKKGTEVMLLLYVVGKDDDEINKLAVESEDDTRKRLNKRMHAMISDIATAQNKTPDEIKIALKRYLIQSKCIVESSSELDVKGLAIAIYYLEHEFIR